MEPFLIPRLLLFECVKESFFSNISEQNVKKCEKGHGGLLFFLFQLRRIFFVRKKFYFFLWKPPILIFFFLIRLHQPPPPLKLEHSIFTVVSSHRIVFVSR